jgi:hypothetical protein
VAQFDSFSSDKHHGLMPGYAPVFIVGVPRSGTTLLVNLIGNHALLAPIYETRFLRNLLVLCERAQRLRSGIWRKGPLLNNFAQSRFLKELSRFREKTLAYHASDDESWPKQDYETFPFGHSCVFYTKEDLQRETDLFLKKLASSDCSASQIYTLAGEYVHRLFAIHCSKMNRPYWVNKTPGLLKYNHALSKLFPNAKVIHIIRDGRDVAASNLSLSWGPATVRDAARRWKSLILAGRPNKTTADISYLELRYESVINSLKASVQDISAFLGIGETPWDLTRLKIYKQRAAVWRAKLSPEDRKIFAKEAGDLLIELGYERDYSWVD